MSAAQDYADYVRANCEGVAGELIDQDVEALQSFGLFLKEMGGVAENVMATSNYMNRRPKAEELIPLIIEVWDMDFEPQALAVIEEAAQ